MPHDAAALTRDPRPAGDAGKDTARDMLKLTHLRKTFFKGTENEVRPLKGVSLTIEAGTFVVVIGTNGSGKSTLLNAVAGAFPLDSGRVELADRDITAWPEHRRAAMIGRVFQDPFRGTAPGMTVAENFALALRRGLPRGLGRAVPRQMLDALRDQLGRFGLGLENRLDAPIGSLSGGQRQALTLLMATTIKPRLLLLDEHTAALDPKSAELVLRLSEDVIRRDALTTLMVTHSMQQAANMGDRLIMMHDGQIAHDFEKAEKRRIRSYELLNRFDEARREDMLDDSAAALLRSQYV